LSVANRFVVIGDVNGAVKLWAVHYKTMTPMANMLIPPIAQQIQRTGVGNEDGGW
jgi:hypothetical protein